MPTGTCSGSRRPFCYLVVHPHTTRQAIAAALWPDLEETPAADNLRVNLGHLAKLLEPDRAPGEASFLLRAEASTVRLVIGPWLRVDAVEFETDFEQAVKAEERGVPSEALRHYEAAIARYHGPFVQDAGEAEWASWERDLVAGRYVRAATRAGELLIGLGRVEEAVERGRLAIRADRWSEPAHRLLVRAWTAAGDRLSATRALEDYRHLLGELGIAEGPETERLARAIKLRG